MDLKLNVNDVINNIIGSEVDIDDKARKSIIETISGNMNWSSIQRDLTDAVLRAVKGDDYVITHRLDQMVSGVLEDNNITADEDATKAIQASINDVKVWDNVNDRVRDAVLRTAHGDEKYDKAQSDLQDALRVVSNEGIKDEAVICAVFDAVNPIIGIARIIYAINNFGLDRDDKKTLLSIVA